VQLPGGRHKLYARTKSMVSGLGPRGYATVTRRSVFGLTEGQPRMVVCAACDA
jgi:hypothetical protein